MEPGLDRRLGALLGTFVGDALGMPFEGAPAEAAPEPLELLEARLGAGTYTDDTQMMIALAEVLAERGEVDEVALAERFLAHFDPRRGYGAGTMRVLDLWAKGVSVWEAAPLVFPGGSFGNGAAMRVAPVGAHFADDPPRLAREAARSARVTHAHPHGVAGAVIVASAVGAAVRGEGIWEAGLEAAKEFEVAEAVDVARRAAAEGWTAVRVAVEIGSDARAMTSVPAALVAAGRSASFEEACTFAVRMGGDADTIAAMAGAIAGARFGASSIPGRWLERLEDGERGRSHVVGLAHTLWGSPAIGEA